MSLPPHGITTNEPALIEPQSTICKSLTPSKILGQKPKGNLLSNSNEPPINQLHWHGTEIYYSLDMYK